VFRPILSFAFALPRRAAPHVRTIAGAYGANAVYARYFAAPAAISSALMA